MNYVQIPAKTPFHITFPLQRPLSQSRIPRASRYHVRVQLQMAYWYTFTATTSLKRT